MVSSAGSLQPGDLRVERVVTSGVFSLDGKDFEVDNNVWLVGTDDRVIVIDAAHDAGPIVEAVAGRRVLLILATHGHNDHINAAADLSARTHAPVALHPDDLPLWSQVYPSRPPDLALSGGQHVDFAGRHLAVLHTPGHSPGGVCVHLEPRAGGGEAAGVLFSGDTLFAGGPGATGRSWSDFPTIISSIEEQLLTLPPGTVVHTGHGDDTTIGAEAPHLADWVARGHSARPLEVALFSRTS